MQIDITQIVLALIGLLSSIVTIVLVPYIKTKLDAAAQSLSADKRKTLAEFADIAVNAAEQIASTSDGKKLIAKIGSKFDFAYTRIVARLSDAGIYFSDDVIKDAIEASLKQAYWKRAEGEAIATAKAVARVTNCAGEG